MGGPQSRSARSAFLKQLNKAHKDSDCPYPHQNWGSTLDGKTQTVSSFGDKYIHNGEVLPVHTHYEVLGSVTPTRIIEVMGSDGFFDVLTPLTKHAFNHSLNSSKRAKHRRNRKFYQSQSSQKLIRISPKVKK